MALFEFPATLRLSSELLYDSLDEYTLALVMPVSLSDC